MIQLSHIGEGLLARMLSDSVSVRNTLFGHLLSSKPTIFVPELRLNNCGGLAFDGVYKIDVAALCLATGVCYPIEAKLGFDRLVDITSNNFIGRCGANMRRYVFAVYPLWDIRKFKSL